MIETFITCQSQPFEQNHPLSRQTEPPWEGKSSSIKDLERHTQPVSGFETSRPNPWGVSNFCSRGFSSTLPKYAIFKNASAGLSPSVCALSCSLSATTYSSHRHHARCSERLLRADANCILYAEQGIAGIVALSLAGCTGRKRSRADGCQESCHRLLPAWHVWKHA